MKKQKLTYKSSGVNYDLLDKLKRMAQAAAGNTEKNILDTSFVYNPQSRGESASIITKGDLSFAFVQEGLGTKNLVADAMFPITGKTYYDNIAQDTVAMIINDLITVGARPIGIKAYWAIGNESWLTNEKRMEDLVNGWKKASDDSGATWDGGETPILSGVIHENTIDLAGSAFGFVDSIHLSLGDKLQAGDAIILFESSGIHANGLSLARKLAEQLPEGYKTKISDRRYSEEYRRMYGEALLDPTIIYAKLIQDLFKENVEDTRKGIDIHYMTNITGHGWRKIMRHTKNFTYRIKEIPPVPPVLQFIQEKAELDDTEAYGNLNMGAGFAIFVPQEHVQKVLEISSTHKIKAYHAGIVEEGEKQVIIEPLNNLTFKGDSLQVRA